MIVHKNIVEEEFVNTTNTFVLIKVSLGEVMAMLGSRSPGLLGENQVIRLTSFGRLEQNVGSGTPSLVLTSKLGSTTLSGQTIEPGNGFQQFKIEFLLMNDGGNFLQKYIWSTIVGDSTATATAGEARNCISTSTTNINIPDNEVFSIEGTFSIADPSFGLIRRAILLEML